MPSKISDIVPPGALARRDQPRIPVPGGLLIRPWQAADAPAVYEAFQDPAMQRWHARVADSVDEALGWIEDWGKAWSEERDAFWAIADASTNAVVGRIALRLVVLADGQAEVAYWTMPAARGRGIAPRALTALSDWAFTEVGLHRLELTHSTANEASCRVALKTGFAPEGVKRSALLHADGWHDVHLHARIRGDAPTGP
ncbi:GNAT family N-acetyltransferase [Streptomyces longisporoflavus]|uniref:GNAT family N-acetyltransferase n=1 Tax=Streptomyces longisporoflavus TaxID=28044 RepID=UPI00167E4B44|nr:GNAT family N-acetyltransferase [Streptomyces longisporoflavus]